MKLSLLWEFLAIPDYKIPYLDPKHRLGDKDPVPVTQNSGFSDTSKSSPPESDMSFLIGGTKDRKRWAKEMGTKK